MISVFTPGVPAFQFASHSSNGLGLDFDPVGDLARIVDRAGDNGYVDMGDGSFHEKAPLATTSVRGIAYDRDYSGASAATLFGVTDSNGTGAAHLLRIGGVDGSISPNGGTTADVGSLGVTTPAGQQDLDIAPDGTGFALLSPGGTAHLYAVDLGGGAGQDLGTAVSGAFALAVVPPASTIGIAPGASAFTVPSNDALAVFTIVRAGGAGTVTIGFHTLDGTALAGRDYTPMLGSIFWTGADTDPKTIAVPISGGRNGQGRSFSLVLSDPSGGASLGTSSATVTFGPPKEGGYWLVASDGGIFTFGDATFCGSAGAVALAKPIVGMAPTRSGGGIFTFGQAIFSGSTGAIKLNRPVVGTSAR